MQSDRKTVSINNTLRTLLDSTAHEKLKRLSACLALSLSLALLLRNSHHLLLAQLPHQESQSIPSNTPLSLNMKVILTEISPQLSNHPGQHPLYPLREDSPLQLIDPLVVRLNEFAPAAAGPVDGGIVETVALPFVTSPLPVTLADLLLA
jgi:hypothetical protein